MKLRKKQKCAALLLVCCILFQTTYYCVVRPNVVYATGAGGAIAGGAVAGLGLTGPEVAVAIAALFGVAAVVDNADTIYTEMNNCINKVTDGLENQAAVISDWWKEAAAGVVDTTSSVWKGVCNWFTGTREQNYNITVGNVQNVKAGEKVNWINYGLGSTYATADRDCSCVEFWYKKGADIQYMLGRFWFSDSQAWITLRFKDGSSTSRSLSYSKDLNFYYYIDTTLKTKNDNWKDIITTYLPNAYYLGEYDIESKVAPADFLPKVRTLLNERAYGGINAVLNDNVIDDAADVIWPDAITLNPDLAADEELASVLEKLRSGELTWTDCWDRVASG